MDKGSTQSSQYTFASGFMPKSDVSVTCFGAHFSRFSLHRNRSPSCEHLDQEDGEMQLLNVGAFSLAKAIELIDNSGLILSSEEASEPRPDRD